jgi:L-glyceraldehyde 3-phosphate reductase
VGASSVKQLEDTLSAISNLGFSEEELTAIDEFAVESDINLWAQRV